MKNFLCLLAAMALLACSDSENAVVFDDFGDFGSSSDILAVESSSSFAEQSNSTDLSSAMESVLLSSSSEIFVSSSNDVLLSSSNASLSSSSEKIRSSSSVPVIFKDSTNTETFSCGTPSFASRKEYNPYELLINNRAYVHVANGASTEDAIKIAKEELYKALGLDTLIKTRDKPITFIRDYSIVDAINYVFLNDTSGLGNYLQNFAETGTLEKLDYCGAWKGVPWFANSGGDETIYAWAVRVGMRGCGIADSDIDDPYLIFSNIHRKCLDLPYCTDEMFGTVKRIGFEKIISEDLYVCSEKGWKVLNEYDRDLKGVPCDKIGDFRKSEHNPNLFYVCREDGWSVASRMAYETRNNPCGTTPQLMNSPVVDTLYYLCKDSKWKIANHLEVSTFGVPCNRDNIGKMVKNKFKENSLALYLYDVNEQRGAPSGYYICRDTGWDAATYREVDIGERVCDEEGKKIQGERDTLMSYVCYNKAWTEFYNAPCDEENMRVRANLSRNRYFCYSGKWYNSRNWSCDFPKEYYFNPDIEYGTLVDERDGEMYKTVDVFGRTWMAENLRYIAPDATQSVPVEEGCEIAGRYYSLDAAETACPAGWRLPDSTDVNSFYTPEYQKLSGSEKSSYLGQFMSGVGSRCNLYDCNVYGTSFLELGGYDTRISAKQDGLIRQTYYWVYGDHSTKDIKHMYFYNTYISYVNPSSYLYLPIRCIKE